MKDLEETVMWFLQRIRNFKGKWKQKGLLYLESKGDSLNEERAFEEFYTDRTW